MLQELAHWTSFSAPGLVRLRAEIVFARSRGSDAPPLLLDAAKQLEPLDRELAREAYLEALGAAVFAGRLNGRVGPQQVAEAAPGTPPSRQPPRPTDLLLDGLATRYTEGYVAGVEPLRRALTAFRKDGGADEDDILRWFWLPWLVAGALWDDEVWHELATRAVRLCRESGALNVLPLALGYRASVHLHAGEFAAATALVEEADAITEATGLAQVQYSWGCSRLGEALRRTGSTTTSVVISTTQPNGAREEASVEPALQRGAVQRARPIRRRVGERQTGM